MTPVKKCLKLAYRYCLFWFQKQFKSLSIYLPSHNLFLTSSGQIDHIKTHMGKRITIKYPIYFLILFSFLFTACDNNEKTEDQNDSEIIEDQVIKAEANKAELSVQTYFTDTIGWGYDIYRNGKCIVHQYHIPAISGIIGFASEEDAQKIAYLVLKKINDGLERPSISLKEIDSLNILIKK